MGIIESPQERELRTGNNEDDDSLVLDELIQPVSDSPDKSASTSPSLAPAPAKETRISRLDTGSILLDPAWPRPTLVLPKDANRERLVLSVIPSKRNTEANIRQVDPTTNPTVTLTAPYLLGLIITQDVAGARILGFIDIDYGNGQTFGFDMAEGSGGGPLAPYSWWAAPSNGFPARADGTIAIRYTNIAGAGLLSIVAIGWAGDADFVNLADDPAKLQQDTGAGRLAECDGSEILERHTGAVWATARNSFNPVRLSWWAVTK